MSSPNLKKLTARLAAVQALYQAAMNKENLQELSDTYEPILSFDTDEPAPVMDHALFKRILSETIKNADAIEKTISQHHSNKLSDIEPLLKAILMCGINELVYIKQTEPPIIINDYVTIADSFYNKSEKSLVNAILDAVAKA